MLDTQSNQQFLLQRCRNSITVVSRKRTGTGTISRTIALIIEGYCHTAQLLVTSVSCLAPPHTFRQTANCYWYCDELEAYIHRDLKRLTQFRTSIFPEQYMVCE